jgi:hypothetical protein
MHICQQKKAFNKVKVSFLTALHARTINVECTLYIVCTQRRKKEWTNISFSVKRAREADIQESKILGKNS